MSAAAALPCLEPDTAGPAPARLLADTLSGLRRLGVTDRGVFDGVLRSTLAGDPRYIGVWSVWEPNALDGRDREHAGQPGHDGTGRYIPLWTRSAGAITVEPNSAYDTGEWYLRPTREGRETVVDPYEYPMAGRSRFITTQVAPIMVDGRCVGAAGVDFPVAQIPTPAHVRGEDNALEALLGRGYVFLEDDGGVAYWSARSRGLIDRFVGPSRPWELPPTLRRLLAEQPPPPNGAGPGFSFRRAGAVLLVRPFCHAEAGAGLLLQASTAGAAEELSGREQEVLDWMAEGKTNAEIAAILGISLHTVKRHVEKVLQKLGAPNRSAAVVLRLGPKTYPGPTGERLGF